MTVRESIIRNLENLPLREQLKVAAYVFSLNKEAQLKQQEVMGRLYGALDEADGEAFEQAMLDSRRLPDVE